MKARQMLDLCGEHMIRAAVAAAVVSGLLLAAPAIVVSAESSHHPDTAGHCMKVKSEFRTASEPHGNAAAGSTRTAVERTGGAAGRKVLLLSAAGVMTVTIVIQIVSIASNEEVLRWYSAKSKKEKSEE